MTDEQIKQNAEEYALGQSANGDNSADYNLVKQDYIAGAHSRDKEIEHYRRIATAYKVDAQDTADECERLHDIIDKLRNPWISVGERLPEVNQVVLAHHEMIIDGGGEHKEDENVTIQRYVGKWTTDRMEQHRMGKWLFDITDRVTHWMPIPEIEKGK